MPQNVTARDVFADEEEDIFRDIQEDEQFKKPEEKDGPKSNCSPRVTLSRCDDGHHDESSLFVKGGGGLKRKMISSDESAANSSGLNESCDSPLLVVVQGRCRSEMS